MVTLLLAIGFAVGGFFLPALRLGSVGVIIYAGIRLSRDRKHPVAAWGYSTTIAISALALIGMIAITLSYIGTEI